MPPRTWLPALAAFAASLYPFAAFWFTSPDAPRTHWLLALAIGVALWLGALVADLMAASGRWVPRVVGWLGLVWLALCLVAVGAGPALAFLLYAAAATALGARLLAPLQQLTPIERLVLAYLAGVAVLVAAASVLLALPVHYGWTYALVCVAILAWQRQALLALADDVQRQWRGITNGGAVPAAALLAVAMWMWGALGGLTPVAAFDDLSYHLRMATELAVRHRYSFDVAHQLWSAAPWGADLAFAIPFVIAGGDGGVKGFVAGSYHFASAVLLFAMLARRLPLRTALLFLVGYLAMPLIMASNHALHTEGLSAALVLGAFALWAAERHTAGRDVLVAVALLVALLGALKSSNLVLSLALGFAWLPYLWRHVRGRPASAVWLLVAFATVLVPYVTSWRLTGNPVLPLFNAYFKSPWFPPENFRNAYFTGMFDLSLYQRLFLSAQRVLETATDVAGGLAVFLLLPAAVLLLAWRGDRERRVALGIALAYSLVLLSSQQYLRYLFPVLGLALYACTRVWEPGPDAGPAPAFALKAWWTLLLLLAAVVGAQSMTRGFWQTPVRELLNVTLVPGGRSAYLERFATERLLTGAANRQFGVHATVLYLNNPFGADLHGTPVYLNWYNAQALAAASGVRDDATTAAFLHGVGATHVVPREPTANVAPPQGEIERRIEAFARAHGRVAATAGNLSLIALDDEFVWSRSLWEKPGSEAGVVRTGTSFAGATVVKGGELVRIEVVAECDSLAARPWVDLMWTRGGHPMRSNGKTETCLPDPGHPNGVARIAAQYEAPARADGVVVRVSAATEAGARVTQARLRGLARP